MKAWQKYFLNLLLLVFAIPCLARDEANIESIQHAIDLVYPALVKIEVVTPNFSKGREQKFEAAGSGVILSADGYVVTNHHVAGKAKAIRCILNSKEELEATLVGTDPMADIAILKLDLSTRSKSAPPLPVAHFGKSDHLAVGETVLAMGCPLALSQSVTKGIIANLNMMMPRFFGSDFLLDGEDVGTLVKWIGHDAQIQPGNSGGPLVNLAGEVVGINEIGLGQMSGAIPSVLAEKVMNEIIQHGSVQRSWLGASFQPLLKSDPSVLGGKPTGVLVSGVLSDSPAIKAGLQAGDIITEVDGTPIIVQFREELPAFHMLLFSKPVGSKLQLKVRRGSSELNLPLVTELRDAAEGKEKEVKEWGLVVEDLTTMSAKELYRADKRGVLVKSVRTGGPADKAVPGISSEDVIVEIGGKPVDTKESFLEVTRQICDGKKAPVATIVTFERQAERLMSVVEVGIRKPIDPTPEAKKAWLPISTQILSRKLATALKLDKAKGVRVTQIYPEFTTKIDLKVGDIITQMDGRPIEVSEQGDDEVFETMVRLYRVGSEVELSLIRDGQSKKVKTVLIEQPKPEKELKVYEDNQIDFKARDISYFDRVRNRWNVDEKGGLVSQVEQGGWADIGGLRDGDLIQEIAGSKVQDVRQIEGILKDAYEKKMKHISFLVRRGISTLYLEIEPYAQDFFERAKK